MPDQECQTNNVFVIEEGACDAEIKIPFRSLIQLYSQKLAAPPENRKQCGKCKVFHTHDKFKMRPNKELHSCCIECNKKKMEYVLKCRPSKAKKKPVVVEEPD